MIVCSIFPTYSSFSQCFFPAPGLASYKAVIHQIILIHHFRYVTHMGMSHNMTNFLLYFIIISSCQHPCMLSRLLFNSCLHFLLQILTDSPVCDLSVKDSMWQFCDITPKDLMWHLLLSYSQMWLLIIIFYCRVGDPLSEQAIAEGFNAISYKLSGEKIVKKNKDF